MLPVDEIRLNFNPASLALLNGVLAFLMFGIALDTRIDDFRRIARMPLAFAVGVGAQFIALPAITFALTLLLQPGPSIALGMILVACCPPGNVSNILTHRANGNVALSVSMTAVSNAIAIVAMPLNFAFWGGIHPTAAPLLKTIALDPLEMVGHILLIIGVPFVLGLWCSHRFPNWTARFKKPLRIISFLALIAFIVGAIAGNWRYFMDYVGLSTVRSSTTSASTARRAAAGRIASNRCSTPGSIPARCPPRSCTTRSSRTTSSRPASRPTSSARPSTRRAGGSTRCWR
jgi:BASS family bile acid:Na+ symporter